MRAGINLAVGAVAVIATPCLAQIKPPILVRAEQCLRSNVDRVVAAESDMNSAANFLTNYACAHEVSGAARYEVNLALVNQFGALGALGAGMGQKAGDENTQPTVSARPSVDPETGDIIVPQAKAGATPDFFTPMLGQMGRSASLTGQTIIPVSLRELAGSLVLEARERQQAHGR